jgi:DNA-binding MarR family transcriptional regulator
MPAREQKPIDSASSVVAGGRCLSALLSQTLVAFTLEFDNEFERRMQRANYPGALLSLVVWSNLIRFLSAGDLSVRQLAEQALAPDTQLKFGLGCLERWGYVVLRPDSGDERPVAKQVHHRSGRLLRDGWGSGRGIRSGWLVRLTEKGRAAAQIWPALFDEIEARWRKRFGADRVANLREALSAIAEQLDLELPQALPVHWLEDYNYAKLREPRTRVDSLPALLSQLLLAFQIEFEQACRVPLALCANTLRVLGETPVPLADIPRLTGASPETADIGWFAKRFVIIEPDRQAKRGKAVRLSPLGLKVQKAYGKLTRVIEERWQARFGKEKIQRLRDCLNELFELRDGDQLRISAGLIPAAGTVRAGTQAPALGRRDVGPAARQRMRDMVAQSERFARDPANSLPHYPLWDMNRGFGP